MPSGRHHVTIHTDGACVGNPGPGGYAAILECNGKRRELSGGRRLTTNNRMELLAAITALEALKSPCRVRLMSDATYVVEGVNSGRTAKRLLDGYPLVNADLWRRLLPLCELHEAELVWVRGHSGDPDNERCDYLAELAAHELDLPEDEGFARRLEREQARPDLFGFG